MELSLLPLLLYIPLAAFYLVSTVINFLRKRLHQAADYFLVLFLGISFLETLLLILQTVGVFEVFIPPVEENLPHYGILLLVGLCLSLSLLLFKKKGPGWIFLGLDLVWIAGILLVDAKAIPLPDTLWVTPKIGFYTQNMSWAALLIGWGALVVGTGAFLIIRYVKARTVFIKNRVRYWGGALIVFSGGALLFLLGIEHAGSFFLFVASLAIIYIIRTYRLPDFQAMAYKLISATLTGLISLLLFTFGFLLGERILGRYSWYRSILSSLPMALILIIFYNPLQEKVKEIVQILTGEPYNRDRALREYSKSISSILEIDLLATVSVGLISEALDLVGGALFLVDEVELGTGVSGWRLRGVKGMGGTLPNLDILTENNIFARVFVGEQRPLTHAEIDLSHKFQTLPENVVSWLQALDVEVFIPIHTKSEWVGLFALAPKRSGASYSSEDLELLGTLADQTAVALQNARLVESLTVVNNEFRRAYAAMENAHEKLERIERTKSDFISIASHELRTPLTVMNGYTQMLSSDGELMENPYYADLIEGLLGGADRLHEIIESMLDVAKIDTRALELRTQPIDLAVLLQRVSRNFERDIQVREQSLLFQGLEDVPKIQGDPQTLEKVFSNLLSNAIKYTPNGGKITIGGQHIPPTSGLLEWEGVEVVVSDTGIGIDPQAQKEIFTRFYHDGDVGLHSSGKTKFKARGAGLGLAVVQGVVEAHGGRVWVESEGKDEKNFPGSDFHIILPLHQPAQNL
ncbi:MAG: Alkaline phosphatase synthesis sensor protein PhoR [Chloroflexi bacterium]|nr:Alkaline phosphatase synthesis sensor protein PhoR [Chloroflexota bacterium]